jgi:oligosaccharide repeat unit polymerase
MVTSTSGCRSSTAPERVPGAEVHDKWLVMRVFFYTSLTMTLMVSGFIAGRRFFGPLERDSRARQGQGGRPDGLPAGLFGACSFVLLLYLREVGVENVALLGVMGFGDDIQAQVARSAMGNAFEGEYHWYHMFMNQLLLFCVYAIFAQYLLRPDFGNRLLFFLVFPVAAFAMVMAVEKGPMGNFLIALFLVHVSVRRKGAFPVKGSIYIIAVLFSLLVVFYMLFMGVENPGKAAAAVASRAFTGQIAPAYHYLEYFPRHHDFLLGGSFPNPGGVLPFKPYLLTTEMMAWYDPGQVQLGIVGSMPTVYWGEMYANYGFAGVLLPPFFIGLVLYWLDSLTLRLRPEPVSIALFVWLAMHLKNLSGSSLSGYFFDIYAFATLFFFFAISFVAGKGVLRLRGRFSRTAEQGAP